MKIEIELQNDAEDYIEVDFKTMTAKTRNNGKVSYDTLTAKQLKDLLNMLVDNCYGK